MKEEGINHAGCGEPVPYMGYLLDKSRAVSLAQRIASGVDSLQVTRAEIFLTSLCNMNCRYCKSKDYQMPEWTPENLKSLIRYLAQNRTKHMQWTGGEVTCHPQLKTFISCASEYSMPSSISTNGTAGADTYIELARSGVQHFFISLDHPDPDIFDDITRTKGQLPKVLKSIELLCNEKHRLHFRVVINMVLNKKILAYLMADNANSLYKHLKWCISVGVDDFKFLPAANIADIFHNHQMKKAFMEICTAEVPQRYTMFHYRLNTLQQGGHGLFSRSRHICYHCLDDRTYDSLGAFPCIIHLRENGTRLYFHNDPPEIKLKQLQNFFQQNRTTNPICRNYCFDLYRSLSDRVAEIKSEFSELKNYQN